MEWIFNFLARQQKRALLAEALVSAALIGWLDWLTGWELSLFILYGIPIFVVVWHVNLRGGLIIAAFSALAWWIANRGDNPYATIWGYPVAATTRLAYFTFVAVGGSAIKAQRDLDRARIEALERVSELERDIVHISESEQRRIGQDLHDDICQELVAIGCTAAMLRDDLASKAMPEAEAAGEIVRLIGNAAAKTRDLARGIFPVQMDDNGLLVALEELVANLTRIHGVNISLIAPHDLAVHDSTVGMHLFRIAQEALSNAIRHGRAETIVVSLRRSNGGLELSVADDGGGFSKPPNGAGMGLRTMEYRAHLMGGKFEIKMDPSGGVSVLCSVPAENPDRNLPSL